MDELITGPAGLTSTAPRPPAAAGAGPRPTSAAATERHTRWALPSVLLLMLAAGALHAGGIHLGLVHNYYGPAVYSMAQDWKAFFWGAFDGSTITMDKIPGAFWVQALSVRLFGWSNWSVLMPQVLQAVAAIGMIFLTVRRWAGDVAGVLASLALATTPVVAALAHSQIVDTQLMLLSICAAWAWTHAMEKGSGRWLALAGVFVGLGFNAKMAQAWGILPALALAYLLFAPGSRGRRWGQTLVAGLVTLAVSLWWVAAASLVPASSRPWIDGAADNSVWTMVFEYNLLGRYESGSGAAASGPGGASGWGYLLGADVASQVGWLYPAAVVGLGLALWSTRRAPRTDLLRASSVMWGLWLAVHAIAFSAGRVAHSFYVVALAPAVVALAATGAVLAWQAWQRSSRLPLLLLVIPTVAWTLWLGRQFEGFRTWTMGAVVVLAAAGLSLSWLRRRPAAVVGATLLVASALLTPAVWAASTTSAQYAGQSIGPAAGPVQSMGGGPGGAGRADGGQDGAGAGQSQSGAPAAPPQGMDGGQPPTGSQSIGQPPSGTGQPDGMGASGMGQGQQSSQAKSVLEAIAADDPGSEYDLVVLGYDQAGSYVLAGGRVISVGGFTGQMGNLTLDELQQLVAEGKVNHVLVGGGQGGAPGGGSSDSVSSEISSWVTENCTESSEQSGLYRCS